MIHYKPISKNDKEKYNKYTYHYGLFWLLPIVIILNILGNTDKFGRSESKQTRFAISASVVTLLIIIIFICLFVSFLSIRLNHNQISSTINSNEKQLAQNIDIHNDKRLKSLSIESIASLNNLFDIPTPTTTTFDNNNINYDINRTYYGILLILSIMYTSINTLITEIGFYLVDEDICLIEQQQLTSKQIGLCVVNRSNFAKIYIIVLAFITIANSYFEVSTNCKIRIDDLKRKLLQRYNKSDSSNDVESIVNKINNKIQRRLELWKSSKDLNNRKIEILITFIIVFCVQIGCIAILRNSTFSNNVPIGSIIFCLWMNIGDSIMFTIIVIYLNTTIRHYSFPTIIMNELLLQIECKNIMDLISWWETRKYYLFCIIDIHGSGTTGVLFTALSGNIAAVAALIIMRLFWKVNEADPALYYIFLILILYITASTFTFVSSAVNFHNNQLNHINMINKEKLILINNNQDEYTDIIIESIELDITQNSHPFKVFGVSLTKTFMLFIQSTTVSIALAFVFGG